MVMKEIVNELTHLAEMLGPDAYLVGGCVRDAVVGKVSYDIDIAVRGDCEKISRAAASAISGSWFALDEARKIFRVVLKKENEWCFDFTPIFSDIKSDLLKRDFTVDAIAVPLGEWRNPKNFIDPAGGIADIRDKIIRMTNPGIFIKDPLRLYRAFRIAALLNGRISEDTVKAIRAGVSLIKSVSGERIRCELYKILETENSALWLDEIYRTKLFHETFGEFTAFDDTAEHYYHRGGLWEHSLVTLRKFEEEVITAGFAKFPEFRKELNEYFTREKIILTKLACLFHDLGKPESASSISGRLRFFGHEKLGSFLARNIMRRLKASRRDTEFVSEIVYSHMRPSNLSVSSSRRAFNRFFRAFKSDAHIAAIFTAYCDRHSYESVNPQPAGMLMQEEFTKNILRAYYSHEESSKKPALVNGNELMRKLNIGPGPLVGILLEEINDAVAAGGINSKETALALAQELKDKIPVMDATIIVPAFNEEKTIGGVLRKFSRIPRSWEVIVVDDGSRDKTAEIAKRFEKSGNIRVISHEKNAGKGRALRTGILNARGRYIAVQDADAEYDFGDLRGIIEFAVKNDFEVVYGSRFLKKNPVRYLKYYLGNRIVSLFISLLFMSKVTDSYTCYKVVRADILKGFELKAMGFEIEAEITSKLLLRGIKINEVPIKYTPRTKAEGKKIKPLDGLKAILTAVRIRVKSEK